MADAPRVFLSYSHDSDEHADRVLALADALRDRGIDVVIDRYVHPAPEEGWPRWMDRNLDEAQFVLMVCTATYRRRVMGQVEPGRGLGVRWEGSLIYNRIYNDKPSGSRFIPVLFEGGEPALIPNPVQGHTYYHIIDLDLSDADYEGLYRHLTSQAPTPPREIGVIQSLPPRPRSVLSGNPRDRSRMLEKVRKHWITGFLERSLSHETQILLGLSERPDAVARPLDLLVQRPDQGERPLPPGTQIVQVFDDNEQLLILGAPGSGKTTLLLELVRDLLDRAARDPTHPIPVVFPLSTWAEARRPLAEWLVEELYQRYDVPRKIGQAWVEANQILPLLDGLDEVKQEHRAACVAAINAFRKAHDLPLVICSRTADYQALSEPLQLYGAIVVQPLSPQQVDSYLTEIGPDGEAVRRAIDHDPMLREMLDSPLMLHIVTAAYAGQPEAQPRLSGTLKERRDHLFGAYVDQMFRRRRAVRGYTQQQTGEPLEQTIHWLQWLAWQMVRHSQTLFYIERLQPDWLPGEQRWAFGLVYRLVVGLVVGLVVELGGVLGYASVSELFNGLVRALAYGLVGGLVGLVGALVRWSPENITCAETVRWSWPKGSKVVDLVVGLVAGLAFGLVYLVIPASALGGEPPGRLGVGLGVGLVGGLGVWLVVWLGVGLGVGLGGTLDLVRRLVFGLDIRLGGGLGGALVVGLGVGLGGALVAWLVTGWNLGLGSGWNGVDLRLMPSLNDVSGIPTEGKNLIIVAAVNNVLHFRSFDGDGKVVMDTDEKRLTEQTPRIEYLRKEQTRQIEDLRKQLESLWPPHELTRSDKYRVITAVALIVAHIGWYARLVFALIGGLVGVLGFRLHLLVKNVLSVVNIDIRDIPNQGIHRSAWNAVVFGLISGLVVGLLVFGTVVKLGDASIASFFVALNNGRFVGLVVGLSAGGLACLKHLALRLLLVRSGSIPWNYVKFLDYAAERILLRKVGGGYIFIHRMLVEYFADRYDASSGTATPNVEPS